MKNLFIIPLLALMLSGCIYVGGSNTPCPSHSVVKKHSAVFQLNGKSTSILSMGRLSGYCHVKSSGRIEAKFSTGVHLDHRGETFRPFTAAFYFKVIDSNGNVVHRFDDSITFKTANRRYQTLDFSMNFEPSKKYKPEDYQILVGFIPSEKQKADLRKYFARRKKS